jgi:type IV secretion system protein VirD4
MSWLLSDISHFLGFLAVVAVLVVAAAVVLHWLQAAAPSLIHASPEQLSGPYDYAASGVYLGSAGREGGPARFLYDGPAHVMTIGPTRTGKSRKLLVPNLAYDTGRSMVVIDVKGELAAITGEWRAQFGEVVYLNPFGLFADDPRYNLKSAGFNPLLSLDPAKLTFVDDAMAMAESVCPLSSNERDPHWPASAQNLLAALLMFIRLGVGDKAGVFFPDDPNNGRVLAPTFGEMRRLLTLPPILFDRLIGVMMAHPFAPIGAKAAQFKGAADNKEIQCILSTAKTQTSFLDSPALAADLAKNGVDFAAFKRSVKTAYLILPPSLLLTHAKWLRLVIESAIRSMQTDEGLDRPAVLFMLDEFAQLDRLRAAETAVTLAAGYGIKLWTVIQNVNQIKRIYADNWESFIDSGVTTVFQCRDVATPEYLSKLSGSRIVKERSESASTSGQSVSEAEKRREYLITQHFYNLKDGELYIYEPTKDGRRLHEIHAPDFRDLPEVASGAIKLRIGPYERPPASAKLAKAA